MKVTGFSFIKNAIKFQYPVAEALKSILPLCDEIIVAVGDSEDDTRSLVAGIDKKVRILDTVWDNDQMKDGRILATQTDIAFQSVSNDSDWCIYIQADEVMHEDGYENIINAMKKWKDNKEVDGLLFKYRHFFGSYDYVGADGVWYQNEIRVIRNDKSIYSYRDAQGFRKGVNKKLKVKSVNAYIHHYGWVQDPKVMMAKLLYKEKIYNDKEADIENIVLPEDFPFMLVNALNKYSGSHPDVLTQRIQNISWKFEYDISKNKFKLKDKFKNLIENLTGNRPFTYKNYKII